MLDNTHKNTIGTAPFDDGGFASAETAVAALATDHNLQRLAHIAAQRLNRLAVKPPGQRLRGLRDPAEFVNQVVELILTGKRKTCARHLRSLASFYNFVQGVLQSVITHELERVVRQGEQVSLDTVVSDADGELESETDVVRDIALSETKAALFPQLREYARNNPVLLQAVEAWEQNWPAADRIPNGTLNHKQTHALRRKARQILQEAASREGVAKPTGKEPLTL